MKDILTDLYNKVINFFQAEKIESENTKETAKSRLRLVLMQDRSNLEPETMAQLREELIEVISKYIVIDKEALGLNLDGDGESMALMLNIPVVRAKKPEEIREALKEAKAKQLAQAQAQQDEKNDDVETIEAIDETEVDEASEEIADGVVEFSEGSIDEICECDGECKCSCQDDETCECECHDDKQIATIIEENKTPETSVETENNKKTKKN